MEKSLTNRRPVIRKQQVLKAVKMKWKAARPYNRDTQLPWVVFKAMLLKGWFYTTHTHRRRHDHIQSSSQC